MKKLTQSITPSPTKAENKEVAPSSAVDEASASSQAEQPSNASAMHSPTTMGSGWVYFTVHAFLYSSGVDLFAWNVQMAQHATSMDEAFPIKLNHCQDICVTDNSTDVLIMLPLVIYFRMKRKHAEAISDEGLERLLKVQLDHFSMNLARVVGPEHDVHAETLRRVKAVAITKITRSNDPDEDYTDFLTIMHR